MNVKEKKPLLKCSVCGRVFTSEEAYLHVIGKGHNDWELIIDEEDEIFAVLK